MLDLRSSPGTPFVSNLLIPAATLIGIALADRHFSRGVMVAPTFNFLALYLFALYMSPRAMAIWACLFLFSTFLVLVHPGSSFREAYYIHDIDVFRGSSAILAAIVTMAVCINRRQLSRINDHLLIFLKSLRIPILISSENGTIFFVNNEAADLLQISPGNALGASHCSLIENLSSPGDSVRDYLNLFESSREPEMEIKCRPRNNSRIILRGRLIPLVTNSERWLVTMISARSDQP